MIVLDSTETRSSSRLPEIAGAKISNCLEEFTGADIMVSVLGMPASSEFLIKKHVAASAILIQRKSGTDFIHSIQTEGINISLSRMIAAGAKQWQSIILTTGLFAPNQKTGSTLVGTLDSERQNQVLVKWYDTDFPYKAYATIRRRIGMRGGCLIQLTCDAEIPGELARMEGDLKYLKGKPTKELIVQPEFPPDPPSPSDPLQTPIEVRDGRRVLSAIRGIGPVKANALWEVYKGKYGHPPFLATALFWASVGDRKFYKMPKVPGWGPGIYKNVRKQMGLVEDQDFSIFDRNEYLSSLFEDTPLTRTIDSKPEGEEDEK